jgi:hypothetical protein
MAHRSNPNFEDLSQSWMVVPPTEVVRNRPTPTGKPSIIPADAGLPSDKGNKGHRTAGIKDKVIWFLSPLFAIFKGFASAIHLTPILVYLMPKTFGTTPPPQLADTAAENDNEPKR